MINLIKNILNELNIAEWRINQVTTESSELFFIKHNLDMRRMKSVTDYSITVFRDFLKDGKAMKGSSSITLVPSQNRDDVYSLLKNAYFAASFVANPTYTLPDAVIANNVKIDSNLSELSTEASAMKFAEAIFDGEAERDNNAIINSAEIFIEKQSNHIFSSAGSDISYTTYTANGEFVVQCKHPEDVEMHNTFEYDSLDTNALKIKVKMALEQVGDRAVAAKELPSGEYDVLLSGENLVEVLSYFAARTSASMVYPGYSTWKIGDSIQNDSIEGEKLNIIGLAKEPFSSEGIPMVNKDLVKDGQISLIHGGARFASYLGIRPTGDYRGMICNNGTVNMDDLKKAPYLYPVCFSDFQMDEMSGYFGGEIRLAYWFDGEKTHIVTGGSVNGSIGDCINKLIFTKEKYDSSNYHGPFAVRLTNVKVAGTV